MSTKQSDFADLNALAIEACDLWQEHLSSFARDPNARAELTRFLEPQRRLLADWAAMMQQSAAQQRDKDETSSRAKTGSGGPTDPATASTTAPGGHAYGDDPLRVAQLALRVAELEKRLEQLEDQLIGTDPPGHNAPRRTQRAAS